ncbi:MAG: tripartite tricarboxylate transporter TctB family protein [Candidatus Binatia bacterium]
MALHKGNLFSGIGLAAFGIYVISRASNLPYGSEVGPGPGFFPLWIGIGLVTFAAYLSIASLVSSWNVSKVESESWSAAGRVLTGWLALLVTIVLLGKIGFALSFVLLTIFFITVLERRRALLAIAVAIGLAVAFQLLFVVALDVSLPKGFWGF